MRYNVEHVTENPNYFKDYFKEYLKEVAYRKYLEQKRLNGNKELYIDKIINTKKDFPKFERCEDFDKLWDLIYKQVRMNWEEVKDIDEIV